MKTKHAIIILLILAPRFQVSGQLKINAGRDTTLCMCSDTIQLGGSPTARNGKEPYSYKWELLPTYYYDYRILASDLLTDTTLANPIIECDGFLNDTVTFVLTVTDADLNSKKDSVKIIISSIEWVTLMYFRPTINRGDSVQIDPGNIVNGIAPFSYHWTPESGLSDPFIKEPFAKPDTSTRYTCLVIDAIGCSASDFVDVVVNPNGIQEITNSTFSSVIYPNPVASNSIIKTSNPLNEKRNIRILNQQGQVLVDDWFYSNTYNIGKKIKQNGLYFFILKNEREIITSGKFVKK